MQRAGGLIPPGRVNCPAQNRAPPLVPSPERGGGLLATGLRRAQSSRANRWDAIPVAPQAPERGRQIRAECRPAGAFRIARAKSHRLATVASRPPLLSELMTRVCLFSHKAGRSLNHWAIFRSLREGQKRAGRTRDPTLCCIIDQVSAPRKSCPPFACRSLIRLDPEIFLLCVHCVLCGSTLPRGEKTKKPQRPRRTQRRARLKARWSGPAAEIVGKRVTFNATRKCHQHWPSSSGLLAE